MSLRSKGTAIIRHSNGQTSSHSNNSINNSINNSNSIEGETRVDAETRMHSAELARTLAQDPKFVN